MKIKALTLLLATSAIISGCSSTSSSSDLVCFSDQGEVMDCSTIQDKLNNTPIAPDSIYSPAKMQDPTLFQSNVNFVLLSEYVEQLAMELESKLSHRIVSPVAVTSFVTLDSTLKNTNLLGNQVSEFFIGELKSVGIPVADFKVSQHIQVTPKGDIAMSRNINDLNTNISINHILTGTMIENSRGMILNARIISLSDNRVLASASKLVPNLVWQ